MNCWKPVIAAVHGMAAGGAFYWLNESDIIICSEDATFFDPHVTYGMTSALERSEEHTSELQSLMRISYAVFCLKKKPNNTIHTSSSQLIVHNHTTPILYIIHLIHANT